MFDQVIIQIQLTFHIVIGGGGEARFNTGGKESEGLVDNAFGRPINLSNRRRIDRTLFLDRFEKVGDPRC
jgi:hypothetical protein